MRNLKHRALWEARLYGILDLGYVNVDKVRDVTEKMLAGGVQVLQLRAKQRSLPDLLPLAVDIAKLCHEKGIPFILNDHPEFVMEVGAAGAHLGQDDMAVARARELAGDQAIIGKSTHSVAQAVQAREEGVDYIGFGPLFATPTKPDYTPIGLDAISKAQNLSRLPVFCIGGIKRGNLAQVLAAGARRVVIVSGILQAADPETYCQECREILDPSPSP
ncbi:MAG TPA: thiamine phosphate synthase [Terrimicrobiaceae bacterium]